MKKHTSLALVFILAFLSLQTVYAIDKNEKDKNKEKTKKEKAEVKATIKTSAQCNMCKKTIEQKVLQVNGVTKATLSLGNKELKVRYNASKTNIEDIRKAITALGYDADNISADKNAYYNLPACCKVESRK
jgi:copper chaperone CopZ